MLVREVVCAESLDGEGEIHNLHRVPITGGEVYDHTPSY